nr:tRNA (adenosine(37)-N6)-threonylcarbamoyltransferase complex dimerization subunit type 1 TsaB [Pseudomarimonas arenosa]
MLAIDTATEALSLALLDGEMLHTRHALMPRQHAEQVLPWIDQLLAEADIGREQLDAVAVGRGPGGFTGVRLGVSLAQGIAFGLDRPLFAESSLAALAGQAQASAGQRVLAAIDARMGELYLGAFKIDQAGLPRLIGEEWLAAVDQAELPAEGAWIGVGSGFAAAEGKLSQRWQAGLVRSDSDQYPSAAVIARLAAGRYRAGERPESALVEPAYLRNKVAQTLLERGQPLPRMPAGL